jgi:hypothetical protein
MELIKRPSQSPLSRPIPRLALALFLLITGCRASAHGNFSASARVIDEAPLSSRAPDRRPTSLPVNSAYSETDDEDKDGTKDTVRAGFNFDTGE